MLFNSSEFLFFFLPIVLLGFLALQKAGHKRLLMAWLTASSLFFYAWWNPSYLFLLIFSAIVNYNLGVRLSRGSATDGKAWLFLGIALNLGLLGYFKYANFFLDNVNSLLHVGWNFEKIILPLAISFYTFQQITYLVDSRKNLTEAHGFLEYSLFVCFFPQLIAGPIVHHSDMLAQFHRLGTVGNTSRNLAIGLSILIIGLFKKVVLADTFAMFSTPIFTLAATGQPLYTLDALAGIFSYTFQLYFDFSGYSDMAIGLACMFGIKLPINFFSPYRAQNISDFWRMWHATLSRFLRDYVYMPLGGFVCSPNRQRFNLFATMFVGGIWHGAGWTFVCYGVCHGIYCIVHQLWRIKVSGPLGLVRNRYYAASAQLFTFLIVVFTLALFRADSIATTRHLLARVFVPGDLTFASQYLRSIRRSGIFKMDSIVQLNQHATWVVFGLLAFALAVCWLLPSTAQLFQRQQVMIDKPTAGRRAVLQFEWRASRLWTLFVAFLAAISLLNFSGVSEFLYFQF
jgi:alginate O-acetyltransferase complex protein AlgI